MEGELSDELAVTFPGMVLTRVAGSTASTGTVRDQAELQGPLGHAPDPGLTLLEARRSPPAPMTGSHMRGRTIPRRPADPTEEGGSDSGAERSAGTRARLGSAHDAV